MDPRHQIEVTVDLYSIQSIFSTRIFELENMGNPLVSAALIEVLVRLRDLMWKSEIYGFPIVFTEDVIPTKFKTKKNKSGEIKNVSDLVKYIRDAVCHPDSDHHLLGNSSLFSFNVLYGSGVFGTMGDITFSSIYDDDVCFFFGDQRIYLKRHILRAVDEARRNLEPLLAPPFGPTGINRGG